MSQGCDVIAFARRPEILRSRFPGIQVVPGDVFKPESIGAAVVDSDAVISTLGPVGRARKTTIYSEGVLNIAKAMRGLGKRRLIACASLIALDPHPDASMPAVAFARLILIPVLGYQYRDAAKMKEELLQVEDLDWSLVGLPRLTNGNAAGRYRSSVGTPLHHPSAISRADLATYLVSIIDDAATYRQWTEVSW
ncbi:MAG TPA: NAD(P)H-binding protein [Nitrososphaerales archaeon]|nr:NAD(P)H-binding protein [Nitrososphaerales archaeon]